MTQGRVETLESLPDGSRTVGGGVYGPSLYAQQIDPRRTVLNAAGRVVSRGMIRLAGHWVRLVRGTEPCLPDAEAVSRALDGVELSFSAPVIRIVELPHELGRVAREFVEFVQVQPCRDRLIVDVHQDAGFRAVDDLRGRGGDGDSGQDGSDISTTAFVDRLQQSCRQPGRLFVIERKSDDSARHLVIVEPDADEKGVVRECDDGGDPARVWRGEPFVRPGRVDHSDSFSVGLGNSTDTNGAGHAPAPEGEAGQERAA